MIVDTGGQEVGWPPRLTSARPERELLFGGSLRSKGVWRRVTAMLDWLDSRLAIKVQWAVNARHMENRTFRPVTTLCPLYGYYPVK